MLSWEVDPVLAKWGRKVPGSFELSINEGKVELSREGDKSSSVKVVEETKTNLEGKSWLSREAGQSLAGNADKVWLSS